MIRGGKLSSKTLTERSRSLKSWFWTLLNIGGLIAFTQFHVAARIFGFESFEAAGRIWPEFVVYILITVVPRSIYLRVFHPNKIRDDNAQLREDLIKGRIKRPPLWFRTLVLLIMLLSVDFSFMGISEGSASATPILTVSTLVLLLFAVIEMQTLLKPGEAVMPDPHDELLAFFRSKVLKVGYSTAVLSLAILTVVTLFIPRYVRLLLPIFLVGSLLIPSFFYRWLDYKSEVAN